MPNFFVVSQTNDSTDLNTLFIEAENEDEIHEFIAEELRSERSDTYVVSSDVGKWIDYMQLHRDAEVDLDEETKNEEKLDAYISWKFTEDYNFTRDKRSITKDDVKKAMMLSNCDLHWASVRHGIAYLIWGTQRSRLIEISEFEIAKIEKQTNKKKRKEV